VATRKILTCVDSVMRLKMSFRAEGLAAVQADKGALPAVLAHVHPQVVLLDETLPGTVSCGITDSIINAAFAPHSRLGTKGRSPLCLRTCTRRSYSLMKPCQVRYTVSCGISESTYN
jgi:hypothetical protein